jgi:hypothetical protein
MRGFYFGVKGMMKNGEKILMRKLLKSIAEKNVDIFGDVVEDLLLKFK